MENNDSQHPRKHLRIMKNIPICIWLNARIVKNFSLGAKRKRSIWEKPFVCCLWHPPRTIKGFLAKTSKSQFFLSSHSQGYSGRSWRKLEQILWSFLGYEPPYNHPFSKDPARISLQNAKSVAVFQLFIENLSGLPELSFPWISLHRLRISLKENGFKLLSNVSNYSSTAQICTDRVFEAVWFKKTQRNKTRSFYWTCSLGIHKSSLAKIFFLTHDFSWFIPQCLHFVIEEFLERK